MGLIYIAIFIATAITNLASPAPASNQAMQALANKDCSYESVSPNSAKVTKIDFGIPAPYYPPTPTPNPPTPTHAPYVPGPYKEVYDLGQDGNPKEWILVKRDAMIPQYKVIGGATSSVAGREMDVIGKVTSSMNISDENGRWIFVALGHCMLSGTTNCIDPMTKDIIFVLQKKGPDSTPVVYPAIKGDANTPYNGGSNYWVFNVYVSKELLLNNHHDQGVPDSDLNFTSDDLPCWLTQCIGGELRDRINQANFDSWNKPCQKGTPVPSIYLTGTPAPTPFPMPGLGTALAPGEDYPPSFVKTEWIKVTGTFDSGWGAIAPYVWFAGKDSNPPAVVDQAHYVSSYGTFDGKLGRKNIKYNVSLKKLDTASFSDIAIDLNPEGSSDYYLYLPLKGDFESRQGENLKLETFKPSPGFVYDWWYPSCKPAIYLYPEKETLFDVSLKPFGILTKSEPSYPFFTGWKGVLADPSGELTYKNNQYDYLYYEGRSFFVKTPQSGFVIKGDELSGFFDAILPDLGLNNKEIKDFKEYWLGRLNDPEAFYQTSILPQEEIERLEGMNISPKPETLIRLRFVFKKLINWQLLPLPQLPEIPQRKGITVVDWGGFYK